MPQQPELGEKERDRHVFILTFLLSAKLLEF
jgi:hypothetical protein